MQTACILMALASGRTVDIEAAAHHANDPGQLAGVATIEDTDHGFRLTPTGNVGQLLAVHALQQSLGEVMRWIEETGGQKLDELRATNNGPVDNLADIVDAAADALRRQDFDAAMLLLGRARQASPQNQDIANLLREIGTQRDAWVRERIEALWEREMAI
jgi:hypothetical protein